MCVYCCSLCVVCRVDENVNCVNEMVRTIFYLFHSFLFELGRFLRREKWNAFDISPWFLWTLFVLVLKFFNLIHCLAVFHGAPDHL